MTQSSRLIANPIYITTNELWWGPKTGNINDIFASNGKLICITIKTLDHFQWWTHAEFIILTNGCYSIYRILFSDTHETSNFIWNVKSTEENSKSRFIFKVFSCDRVAYDLHKKHIKNNRWDKKPRKCTIMKQHHDLWFSWPNENIKEYQFKLRKIGWTFWRQDTRTWDSSRKRCQSYFSCKYIYIFRWECPTRINGTSWR